jgi:hypothetical protein
VPASIRATAIEIEGREWDDYRVRVTLWKLERYLPVL